MSHKLTPWRLFRESAFYIGLITFALFMLLPFYWTIVTSIKPDGEIFTVPIQWWPTRITLEHYAKAFTLVPFPRYFWNTAVIAVGGVILNLFFGSLAGYAFARMRFRGRKALFRLLLLSLMVPGIVTLIPSFIILRSFPLMGGNNFLGQGGIGFLNTYWAVLLPGAAGAFAVFLMRQFFLTLPSELADVGRIDGASEFRIFWNIYLPLATPALATLAIFTFQAGWNQFLWPLIVFSDTDMSTVQMGLQAFSYNYQTDYGPLMAASIAVMLPVVILFLALQRFFVRGIAFTGTK